MPIPSRAVTELEYHSYKALAFNKVFHPTGQRIDLEGLGDNGNAWSQMAVPHHNVFGIAGAQMADER